MKRVGIGKAVVTLLLVAGMTLAASVGHAQTDPKVARACRKEIAGKLGKVIKAGIKVIQACHKSRDKGKFTGDCNDLAVADAAKGAYAKAQAGAIKGIDKKCQAGNVVLGNYAGGDVDGALFPEITAAVEELGTTLLGTPALVGDKAGIKCHGEIANVVAKVLDEVLKGSIKCQAALDKTAVAFGALAGNCVTQPLKSGPKGTAGLGKKCAGLDAAAVGSCGDLAPPAPAESCVVTATSSTAQSLASAIYGEPTPGCGNSVVDPGEACDDGNTVTTDACVECHLATCGDGHVRAGVELCGDAPASACATPTPDTCADNLQPCGESGSQQSISVRFAKPASKNVTGLTIALDYPEGKVGIPGTANEDSVAQRISNVPEPFFQVNDRDYEVEVSVAALSPIAAGTYFTVSFEACLDAPAAALSEFACIVRQASDDANMLITSSVTCSVVSP